MLARMKQKTRYNVRLAEKKGVTVRVGTEADLSMLYEMYAETSMRDGFVIRDEGYYQTVWQTFMRLEPSSFIFHLSSFVLHVLPWLTLVHLNPSAAGNSPAAFAS
jgi:hypothetical protein